MNFWRFKVKCVFIVSASKKKVKYEAEPEEAKNSVIVGNVAIILIFSVMVTVFIMDIKIIWENTATLKYNLGLSQKRGLNTKMRNRST